MSREQSQRCLAASARTSRANGASRRLCGSPQKCQLPTRTEPTRFVEVGSSLSQAWTSPNQRRCESNGFATKSGGSDGSRVHVVRAIGVPAAGRLPEYAPRPYVNTTTLLVTRLISMSQIATLGIAFGPAGAQVFPPSVLITNPRSVPTYR